MTETPTTCAYCDEEFDPGSYGRSRTKDHIVPRVVALAVAGFVLLRAISGGVYK